MAVVRDGNPGMCAYHVATQYDISFQGVHVGKDVFITATTNKWERKDFHNPRASPRVTGLRFLSLRDAAQDKDWRKYYDTCESTRLTVEP